MVISLICLHEQSTEADNKCMPHGHGATEAGQSLPSGVAP